MATLMTSVQSTNSSSVSTDNAALPAELQRLHDLLQQQKIAYLRDQTPTAQERQARLTRLRDVLNKYQDDFAQAISNDYSNRSIHETKIGEIMTCLDQIEYYIKHIPQWMKPAKRHVSNLHQPGRGWVDYQPLGVIGIIAPWNYPLVLSIGPLICALAAGNRAMLKMSSSSRHLGALLQTALAEAFDEDLVAVVNGSGPVSDAFCHLAFDKMIFTGSTEVGKTVMRAAADNLVPVILELGGKSPTIIHADMPIRDAAQRIAFGKLWNAGQTCVAPDYLFVPRGKSDEFVEQYSKCVRQMYPTLLNNPDFTAMINDKQLRRVQGYLDDARNQGARVIEINPKNEDLSTGRKLAPALVTGVSADMDIMKNEIFAPVLPILEYDNIEDVIDYINARPRPLALYYFDYDQERADALAARTHSGHFGINQVLTHVAQDDLPFGGVGASGMGKYHGPEGFYAFSHERSVMSHGKIYSPKLIFPPFGRAIHKLLFKTKLRK